jgi:hypothetical protein
MHKVTQFILEKRKLILPLCLLGIFVNLALSKLCRGEFFVLVSAGKSWFFKDQPATILKRGKLECFIGR